jgi:hypothetical protein
MSNSSNRCRPNRANVYVDLYGTAHSLADLSEEERSVIDSCDSFARQHSDWNRYGNFWMPEVVKLYSKRGLSRREITQTVVWRVAQDIGSRLGIASGHVRAPDYRDEIEDLIRTRYRTKREFCEATGLSEDMLSHVLARRKHLAIDTLEEALGRIGYTLRIMPAPTLTNS